jgi:hypothetical protein
MGTQHSLELNPFFQSKLEELVFLAPTQTKAHMLYFRDYLNSGMMNNG